MSSPLIWIGMPLAMAVVLWFYQERRTQGIILASGFCLLLAFFAVIIPINTVIVLGPVSIEVVSTLGFLGRRFLLDSGDRSFLVLLYGIAAFWFFGASMVRTPRYFLSLGMAIIAFSVAALAVEPFLYAALLVEVVVLLSIPLLVPPGTMIGQGVLRYLIFQTLALPFILFAGWAAGNVQANPADEKMLLQALAMLGLGFAFWLAVFPFHTWVPLVSGEAQPYIAGFILSLLPTVVLIQMLAFLDAFAWVWQHPLVPEVLRAAGAIMVVSGGLWAAFQLDLTRLFGYAVILEIGFSLLALSLNNPPGLELFASFFLPRTIALGVASLALSNFGEGVSLTFPGVRGLLRRKPVTSLALLIALFSMGNLPLLAGFPIRQVLFENLAQKSLGITIWVLIGNMGFLAGVIRAAAAFTQPSNQEGAVEVEETIGSSVLMGIGSLFLFFIGIFPGVFLPVMLNLLKAFNHIY